MKKMVVVFASMLFVKSSYSMDLDQIVQQTVEEQKKTEEAFKGISTSIFRKKNTQQQLQQVELAIEEVKRLKMLYEIIIGQSLLADKRENIKATFDSLSDVQRGIVELNYMKGILEGKSKSSWCLIS